MGSAGSHLAGAMLRTRIQTRLSAHSLVSTPSMLFQGVWVGRLISQNISFTTSHKYCQSWRCTMSTRIVVSAGFASRAAVVHELDCCARILAGELAHKPPADVPTCVSNVRRTYERRASASSALSARSYQNIISRRLTIFLEVLA